MRVQRLIAIGAIFVVVSVAWLVLGRSMQTRTHDLDTSLSAEMNNLWGPKVLVQVAPHWVGQPGTTAAGTGQGPGRDSTTITPGESRVRADIHLDQRNKGLLWYSTFTVKFTADYTVPAAPTSGRGI